jgi:hypothetical protein
MAGAILVFLILLFLLGFIQIPFSINNIVLLNYGPIFITLYDLIVFLFIIFIIDLLPESFRAIAYVILLLYILSFLGILAITGFSSIIVLGLIIGFIVFLVRGA